MNDELKERVKALAIQHLRRSANGHIGDDFEVIEFAQAVARECTEMMRARVHKDPCAGEEQGENLLIEAMTADIRARYGLAS